MVLWGKGIIKFIPHCCTFQIKGAFFAILLYNKKYKPKRKWYRYVKALLCNIQESIEITIYYINHAKDGRSPGTVFRRRML